MNFQCFVVHFCSYEMNLYNFNTFDLCQNRDYIVKEYKESEVKEKRKKREKRSSKADKYSSLQRYAATVFHHDTADCLR